MYIYANGLNLNHMKETNGKIDEINLCHCVFDMRYKYFKETANKAAAERNALNELQKTI